MRIGIDARTLSYEHTGIPIFVHDVLQYWSEYKKDDEYYLYSNRDLNVDFELGDNWHIVIDKHRFGGIWVQTRLRRLLKRDKIEAFWEPMNFLPARIKGVSYYVTVHDLAVYLFPKFGAVTDSILERLLLKKSCKRADKIIAISESTKRDIATHLGIQDEKIEVIYNGDSPYKNKAVSYSEDTGKEILSKWNLIKREYLLFVGTIEPRKNVGTIVAAYEQLRDTGEYTGKLVIAGKKGWKCNNIIEKICNSRYRDDIIVTGYVSETEKECLYRNAKCLVFPSLYEGFGFPILEAMSVDLPVVTGEVSSMPEIGRDAVFYVRESELLSKESVAAAISKAINISDEERAALKDKMHIIVESHSRLDSAESIYQLIRKGS